MTGRTIYAFASGMGRAAIGVFRISGPKTADVVTALTGSLPRPRVAHLTDFRAASGEVLDRGLVLWFPGPASFTGEDMAECQVHGGPAVVASLVKAFADLGLASAEPGEFTRRAFLNGKLDLSAVEGIADLIEAETEAQRRQAVGQMSGRLRERALFWRAALLEAAAGLEGLIDFADEADVSPEGIAGLDGLLTPVLTDLESELSRQSGERIREGLKVVLAGRPNAGKSALFNALAGREAAIVSPFAGTTRDLLEVRMELSGIPVLLQDTAGLHDSLDPIEAIGMARARETGKEADLVLWLAAPGEPLVCEESFGGAQVWVVATKADLRTKKSKTRATPFPSAEEHAIAGDLSQQQDGPPRDDDFIRHFSISAESGKGLADLLLALSDFAIEKSGGSEPGLITRQRHREAFEKAASALRRITTDTQRPIEFLAEDLRISIRALESLIGTVDAEDVLGEIFSRFCIGK